MVIKWEPQWYELDQSIVVGDVDFFYLSKDNLCFANGFSGNDCEVKAEILTICHLELGDIKGIIAIGLSYTIYLSNGDELIVNAEEAPGMVEGSKYTVSQWDFDVQISIIEETGISSEKRLKMLSSNEKKTRFFECIKNYKALLNLTDAHWDRYARG